VLVRLRPVLLEGEPELGVVRRRDHPVEQTRDVLLHRVGLVDVLDQLLLELTDRVQPPHRELTELASGECRPARVAVVLRLELVHERCERRPVVKVEAAHLERHAG
jgi:hypothetical protein